MAPISLKSLPPIYVLPAHMTTDELHDFEDMLQYHDADLTYDIREARLVLGKVGTKKRAEFELRSRGVRTEEVTLVAGGGDGLRKHAIESEDGGGKRRKIGEENSGGSETEDESVDGGNGSQLSIRMRHEVIDLTQCDSFSKPEIKETLRIEGTRPSTAPVEVNADDQDVVKVLKLPWFEESVRQQRLLDMSPYIVYASRLVAGNERTQTPAPRSTTILNTSPKQTVKSQQVVAERPDGSAILERARADAGYMSQHGQDVHNSAAPHGARKMGRASGPVVYRPEQSPKQPAKLLEMSTEDYEGGSDMELPPAPTWVKDHVIYACQRVTPPDPPNDSFIDELKKIRLARILTNDEIGVRAYSSSIASLAAYPYKIISPRELLRLPGCDVKIANLWVEWKNNDGKIRAAEEAQTDSTLQILNLFYEIWGVGATTAREFYFDKGWRDLDDIVEYGWTTLNRVQQIGIKYYDEFKEKIPRYEVEFIANKVREHAVKVRDEGIELTVVGGYRRGKKESGDVDMIVSHRHLEKTAGLVQDIVESLEQEGWITHTLTLSLTSTHRNQSTLPFKSAAPAGTGFDTLDKALVVWQDPNWPTMGSDLKKDPKCKNPNVHRRVDIIVSPWRTVGCAVLGWTSGTTFQRDFRRYARNVKGWKFDSSGVRDRRTGEVIELEGPEGVSGSMVDAEKKVFEGFGLEYREPWERCTG